MKNIKIIMLASMVLAVGSCKKFDKANTSPNQTQDAPLNVILPSAQVAMAYAQGGDIVRYSCVFTQQVTGASRQFAAYQKYTFNEADFDNVWPNIYSGCLVNLSTMITKADAKKNFIYAGIARVMMAYSLGVTTDVWGDIPYSEALKGLSNLQPAFDGQDKIYTTIHQLLTDGIARLADSTDASILQPSADDLIYGGDATKWVALAHALDARYWLHTSKRNGATAYTNALASLAAGSMIDNTGNAQVPFGTTEANGNPMYQYIQQRDDISYSGTLDDSLTAWSDPRLAYYNGNGGYPADVYVGISAPVMFMSYSEQMFISAECKLMTGDNGGAQTDYLTAIGASMANLGIVPADIATYLAGPQGTLTGSQANMLNQIITQKYAALYLHPEPWTDWRRTGYPTLYPNAGAVISEIPRRFIYPGVERSNNSHCPQTSGLTTPRVWWDN